MVLAFWDCSQSLDATKEPQPNRDHSVTAAWRLAHLQGLILPKRNLLSAVLIWQMRLQPSCLLFTVKTWCWAAGVTMGKPRNGATDLGVRMDCICTTVPYSTMSGTVSHGGILRDRHLIDRLTFGTRSRIADGRRMGGWDDHGNNH